MSKQQENESREQSFYQTGSTRPPKNRQGLVAFLLVALILLGSITGALGILNIQLFRQLTEQTQSLSDPVRFDAEQTASEATYQEPTGSTSAPSLGLSGHALSDFDQMVYGLPSGIYITAVDKTSDAAVKGICPGDILLQLEGVQLPDTDTFQALLGNYRPGDTVTLVTYRSGEQHSVSVTLGEEKE